MKRTLVLSLVVIVLAAFASAQQPKPPAAAISLDVKEHTLANGLKILMLPRPGVSTKMSWARPSIAMPRTSARVVCTLGLTIVTLPPTSALTSVDLPTLGAPITATKPHRVGSSAPGSCAPSAASAIGGHRSDALAGQQRRSGGLFGRALGAAEAFRRR